MTAISRLPNSARTGHGTLTWLCLGGIAINLRTNAYRRLQLGWSRGLPEITSATLVAGMHSRAFRIDISFLGNPGVHAVRTMRLASHRVPLLVSGLGITRRVLGCGGIGLRLFTHRLRSLQLGYRRWAGRPTTVSVCCSIRCCSEIPTFAMPQTSGPSSRFIRHEGVTQAGSAGWHRDRSGPALRGFTRRAKLGGSMSSAGCSGGNPTV